MVEQDWLSERFAEHQDRLRAMAYRMLGSPGEAEDAVQEAWLRASRADASAVENLAGWLTTIVARVCLNMLEARRSRPEDPFFAGRRAEAARLALVNGIPAAVWAPGGRPRVVFTFTIAGAKITGIGLAADPDLLRDLDIVFLSSRGHRSAKRYTRHSA